MASDSTKHRVNLILGNMFRTSGKPLTREEFVTSSSPGDGYGTESPTKGSPVFSHSGGDGEKRGKKTHSRLKAGKTNFYGAFPFMNKRKRLKEEVCEEDEETRKHSTRSMFISPKSLLVVLAWLNFCAGFLSNGIYNVNVATLERRFDLHSSEIAWLIAAQNLAAGLAAAFCGYYGDYFRKGRQLAVAALILASGSVAILLPHVLSDTYRDRGDLHVMCERDIESSTVEEGLNRNTLWLILLLVGSVLHGVAVGVIQTLSLPYLDDNIQQHNLAFYTGLMLAGAAVGAALGYILGGYFLDIYVDVGRVDMSSVTLDPHDPGWVGAWWIGFVVAGIAAVITSPVIMCFPDYLPGSEKYKIKRESQQETQVTSAHAPSLKTRNPLPSLTVVKRMRTLFCNPVWALLAGAAVIDVAFVISLGTFLPKVIQFQFSKTPAEAAIIVGVVTVVGAAGGFVLGGLIPKLLKLRMRGLLLQCLICSIITMLSSPAFLLKCETTQLVGVNTHYLQPEPAASVTVHEYSLYNDCSHGCNCTTEFYEPICGSDDLSYFSPCHAGCTVQNGKVMYDNCSCISSVETAIDNASIVTGVSHSALSGLCDAPCRILPIFILVFFVGATSGFLGSTASIAAAIRCVPESEKSFSLGLRQVMQRVIGSVSIPIIVGIIFDDACIVWQSTGHGKRGACWIYSAEFLGVGLTLMSLVCRVICTACYGFATRVYKDPLTYPRTRPS